MRGRATVEHESKLARFFLRYIQPHDQRINAPHTVSYIRYTCVRYMSDHDRATQPGLFVATGPTPPSRTASIASSKLGDTAVLSNAQSATATVLQMLH